MAKRIRIVKTQEQRVSSGLYDLLADPISVPENQPFCMWCKSPKTEDRKRRACELCGKFGTCQRPTIRTGVILEEHR